MGSRGRNAQNQGLNLFHDCAALAAQSWRAKMPPHGGNKQHVTQHAKFQALFVTCKVNSQIHQMHN
jgi:hypothetical protein